jgi:hypothetical protein
MLTVLWVFRQRCFLPKRGKEATVQSVKFQKTAINWTKIPCENQENYNKQVIESLVRAAPNIYSSLLKYVLSQGREPWMIWKEDEKEFSKTRKKIMTNTAGSTMLYRWYGKNEIFGFLQDASLLHRKPCYNHRSHWLGGGGQRSNGGTGKSDARILGYGKCRWLNSRCLHHP